MDVVGPTLLRRLQTGITRNLVASVFNQGSTFALNVVAAWVLGRLLFGEFTIIQTTLTTVSGLGQFATGYTATKYVAEFRNREPGRASNILGLCGAVSGVTGALVALGLLIAAPYLAVYAFQTPSLSTSLRVAAPAVLFTVMNGFRIGALGGLEGYGALATVGTLSGISYLILGTVGAFWGGVNGALAGIAASAFLQWVLLGSFLTREGSRFGIRARYDRMWSERDVLARFALPASLGGFVTLPALWLGSTSLVRQAGFEQMALFAAANTFRVIVLFLPNTVNAVGMSLLNNQRSVGGHAYKRVFWWNLGITAALAVPVALLIALGGKWLLALFGRGFEDGHAALMILMIAAVIEALEVAVYQVVQSQARLWLSLFVIALPRDSLIVVLAYLLSSRMGAAGLATSYAIAWTVALFATVALALRLGIDPHDLGQSSAAATATAEAGPFL